MAENSRWNCTLRSVIQFGENAKNRWPKTTMWFWAILVLVALSGLLCGPTLPAAAQTTSSFAYQGRLLTNGQPVSGSCAFQFSLYDAASAGTQLGTTLNLDAITVNDGYFKTNLDFGLTPFTGAVRYLDVSVKCASETAFTSIGRQPLAAAPQALVAQAAQTWAGLTSLPANLTFLNSPTTCTSGQVAKWNGTTWACGDITVGTDTLAKLTCTSGQAAKWNGTAWGCGDITVGTDTLAKLTCSSGQVAKWDGTAWACAADTDTTYTAGTGVTLTNGAFSVNTSYWGLTGNAGTTVGTNFIGTTDNQALEFKVNGLRVLSLAPGGTGTEIPNIIGGFSGNNVASGVKGATIGGGGEGGYPNSITTNYATICGGTNNTASGVSAAICGGGNSTASGLYATVGGGNANNVSGEYATVAGGGSNTASGNVATVGGGGNSTASGTNATVGGGSGNNAQGNYSFIGGGYQNNATGNYSLIGGGYQNTTSGGDSSTVGGGSGNTASGSGAAVGGGMLNVASGLNAMVSGGRENAAAGDFSFAAGYKAKVGANHAGAFLWADSNDADFVSAAANEFAVRATGGVRFITNAGGTTGATLAAGSGSWSSVSDRNAKANFMPVDSQAVLQKVVALPLSTWNYKAQEVKIRHMGPMAQDLYQSFGLGENEKQISTVDADGVALAAIQGLAQQAKIQKAQIEAQQEEIALLKARLITLEVLLKQK